MDEHWDEKGLSSPLHYCYLLDTNPAISQILSYFLETEYQETDPTYNPAKLNMSNAI